MARRILLLLALVFGAVTGAEAASDIGIVILHGTQGMPNGRVTAGFENAMKSAGHAIDTPEMCWSRNRGYDAAFPNCLRDIDTAIARLRAAGARRFVIAGQSEGGNAALVYAASHPGIAGVIALAPAGNPIGLARNPVVRKSLDQARQMAGGGHAGDRASFTSVNDGRPDTVFVPAATFLSFTDPQGPAVFTNVLPKITVPVLWVAGDADRTQDNADAQFATLPANRLNRLVHVNGPHLDTPQAAIPAALAWLSELPSR